MSQNEKLRGPLSASSLRFSCGLIAVITSNVFYYRALATFGAALYYPIHAKGVSLKEMAETNDVLFAADGPNATVAVIQSEDYLALQIDGKIDASNLDTRTQLLLGDLPAIFHSHPRRVLVIGFGSGMTLAALARYSEIERLDCVEIEPQVIRAARHLEKLNGGVLQDPRVHLILDDARNFLATTRERYDVISSEPSNPWIAGIANLYTSEFYRECRRASRAGRAFRAMGAGLLAEFLGPAHGRPHVRNRVSPRHALARRSVGLSSPWSIRRGASLA